MSVERRAEGKTRIRFYLAFWLFVMSAVAFMDRSNVSIAGLQIMRDFGLSSIRLGSISSAFLLGYAGMQIPAGWAAAKFGPRKVLTVGVLVWAVATGLTVLLPAGMGHALLVLLALRFILGAGESVMYPGANQFVARWIPRQERGKINGLIFAGVGAGTGLTPPLLNWLITNHGWRSAFCLSAVLFLIAGIVWWLGSRDTPEEHPLVSTAELRTIQEGISGASLAHPRATTTEVPTVGEPPMENKVPWGAMLRRRDLIAMMVSYFGFCYVAWIFFAWFFIYMATVRHVNLKLSAIYTMMPYLAMMVGSLLGGVISDKMTQRYGLRMGRSAVAVASLLLTAVFMIVGSQVESAGLAVLFLAGGAGALYLGQSSPWSVSADVAGRSSGVFSAIINMFGQIGAATTASLTPWIASKFGWTTAFAVAAAMAVVGALCWLIVHPERPLEQTRANDDVGSRQQTAEVRLPGVKVSLQSLPR
jgi:MFS transporter, ACS family, glucarate transporter